MSPSWTLLAAIVAVVGPAGALLGDTIKLEGGGTIRGQVLEDQSTPDVLVIKLQIGGGEVTIDRKKVQAILYEKNAAAEYDEIKGRYGNTAEDQFKLAMWCEENKLSRQRREHLLKTIELDPDHAGAREKLGYVRSGGKWLNREEQKEAKGLVRFNGRYVTPQEKEILEQKKREDEATREWHARIRMWKTWLTGSDNAKRQQAEDSLLRIDDPRAVDPVVTQLGKEESEPLRALMCNILGNVPGERATLELVKRSIIDASPQVRWAAVDRLVERQDPVAVRSLLKALSSEHNTVIRRAAEALGAIGDPDSVLPLIGVLVTRHKQVVTRGMQGASFGTNTPEVIDFEPVVGQGVVAYRPIIGMRSSGVGIGSAIKEVVSLPVENQEVLDALESITKQNLRFNQAAWRQWYATEMRREELRNRRQLEER